ncbi:MAG: DUF3368 domain-containing protein [Chloroflexi bacterium]|nr:DUF3368 domain-containing protein [Chloroflexota bacterium]
MKIVALTNPRHALVYTRLDRGEAEVLALVVEHSVRLIIMDERKGRQYAHRLGLPLTGTLGVLLLAKEKELVTAVAPLINRLLENGLYLSPGIFNRTLALSQEKRRQLKLHCQESLRTSLRVNCRRVASQNG